MNDQHFIIRSLDIRKDAAKAVMAIRSEPLMEVIIRRHKKRRSLEQNSKFHAMLNDLAEFTGHDVYELKGYIKGSMGIKHTADMDKMPFVDLIERTYALGAELGFNWPKEET
jgi:hypothetical protein